ncbi:hypothetical protein AAHB53_01085 [Niallia circulans]
MDERSTISGNRYKKEEKDVAKKHAKSALKHTKGIQYYVLKKTYEREFNL